MRKCDVKRKQGFTLMELLVVLLIIGILSTVALRTIDATRDRSLFDQTTKEMNQLVQAITGNPDMTYDGRRVDFGFFGDMEKLPGDLRDLVRNPGEPNWHGPYLRRAAAGDTAGYLLDGWGHQYVYIATEGTISSGGNSKYPMTVRVADSPSQLYNNIISGTVTDRDGNPPGTQSMSVFELRLFYNNPGGHSIPYLRRVPDPGGYYEFSDTTSPIGLDTVPMGIHKLVAYMPGETLTRWVTVLPRSRTVVDFKFAKSFWNRLRLSGPPLPATDGSGFRIFVVNDQTTDATVSSIQFFRSPDAAYMTEFWVEGTPAPITPGAGQGDTITFASLTIAPNMSQQVEFMFQKFFKDSLDHDSAANVCGKEFQLHFSEGSEIKFVVPFP